MEWTPRSWERKPSTQQPVYPDEAALLRTLEEIAALPPLVTSYEIEALKSQLAEAARGERFILWGGDCAESFADCSSAAIASKLKILLQMSLVLVHGTRKRITRIGRFAGQYAKPRSTATETRDGIELPSFRGDNVNRPEFTIEARTPDAQLLLRGYERSALTLNFIRSLVDGGFADLHHPENWDLAFVKHSPLAVEYQRMVDSIGESLRFMETLAGGTITAMQRVDFFTSHELLVLAYEAALTRRVPRREGWFNLSTHLPWIGLRTSDPTAAHIEFCRGIRNPVGVKVGPDTTPEQLLETVRTLSPMAPRCTGTCGALATSPPVASKMAQEKSSLSLIFTERLVFCSTAPVCSAMLMNRLLKSSSITGSGRAASAALPVRTRAAMRRSTR